MTSTRHRTVRPTRRTLLAAVVASALTGGCSEEREASIVRRPRPPRASPTGGGPGPEVGRLSFRPTGGTRRRDRSGLVEVGGAGGRGLAYVPPGGVDPLRLLVMLHGAGGEPERTVNVLLAAARRERFALLVPKSQAATWDVIAGGFGPDVEAIDALLQEVSGLCAVERCSVGGFSDGASYALTLGLTNGDLFRDVIAFSPGFTAAQEQYGRPRFFVSHGVGDRVLPIERCSRQIVPALRDAGYDVRYEEFEGGHEVPGPIRAAAVDWLL